ncbi:MAG TPA: ABC transporter permease [Clostridiales bacterium]|nr:ABC transporter permease [Clostridiales bacterium]HOJ35495.1 ABC transporter permease [Clostridiales bacterium]HOL79438.1 ABC transporter permease [Clostridiales bacterium]HPP68355.1 ABC transporter permease [Clostridiales bacterium]HPU67063.1 ABC transporter permease [Clostridiales bacterium]
MSNGSKVSTGREPLIRIVKREYNNKLIPGLIRAGALILSIIAGGLFIWAMGFNPFEAYKSIIRGALVGSARDPMSSIRSTIDIFVPLCVTALGLSCAFKMKFWNIGGEGQIIMGGVFATFFALNYPQIPRPLMLLIMLIAGAVGGALMALIPALFKVKFGTNETLFTLMLNYIAIYIVKYLIAGPWQRTPGFASIGKLDKNTYLYEINRQNIGWIAVIIVVLFVYFYLYKTKSGYEVSVVGESQATARYAGMNIRKIIIKTMLISGAICGIVGMIKVSSNHTLTEGIGGGVGFAAITVAWLSQLNPFIIPIVSAIISILQKGSTVMQMNMGISSYAADVLQGIILFCFLGSEFFVRYSLVFNLRIKEAK